ncbi:TIGR03087 family PEP-CTERM/XrtA system glycosyltransferase [Thalassotalea sp. PP2-459]|uniref:TIGR03087 family PEP-CTERM/XrtA system glycosyltransferase n=1 Tax=Thalassotalea sp. PP2-459 TaxID=1742724 RepID=UPI000943515A|nr:TIGR03087 family PEP-CTERM/XrtA system glycosyltransferase [Thalassotalea sp. PP2-459]OKY26707.1 glycosyl transferase family 1 [Thalassotalea sp. PP2-459]
MNKEPLLYLCHRIPYPPNKGDKIRSFNILKKLSESYDVYLGCFIDDPFDKQYVSALNKYCVDVCAIVQNKTLSKIKGLKAFFTGQAITLPYYADTAMKHWVNRTFHQQNIKNIFVYSSSMAQYCQDDAFSLATRVIDFVDVDSDKWRQYAEKKSGIAKWVFQREHEKLAQYEAEVTETFTHSLFVSPDEAALFKSLQAEHVQNKIHGVLNGVDVEFFDPEAEMANESLPEGPFISFTGAMDYWANVDSVLWFAEHVWPKIQEQAPHCLFYIVGGNPSAEVEKLAEQSGIIVTGRVHDIRPYIAHAACVVAPMQIARGIQNKVLEAMSLNKPIVTTTMGMEGINAPSNEHLVISDDPVEFTNACVNFLADKAQPANRQWVIDNFTWQATLANLPDYFSGK